MEVRKLLDEGDLAIRIAEGDTRAAIQSLPAGES